MVLVNKKAWFRAVKLQVVLTDGRLYKMLCSLMAFYLHIVVKGRLLPWTGRDRVDCGSLALSNRKYLTKAANVLGQIIVDHATLVGTRVKNGCGDSARRGQ